VHVRVDDSRQIRNDYIIVCCPLYSFEPQRASAGARECLKGMILLCSEELESDHTL
jgi:hypothetical protein